MSDWKRSFMVIRHLWVAYRLRARGLRGLRLPVNSDMAFAQPGRLRVARLLSYRVNATAPCFALGAVYLLGATAFTTEYRDFIPSEGSVIAQLALTVFLLVISRWTRGRFFESG